MESTKEKNIDEMTEIEIMNLPVNKKTKLILQAEGIEEERIDGRCLIKCKENGCSFFNPMFFNNCEALEIAKRRNKECRFFKPFEID